MMRRSLLGVAAVALTLVLAVGCSRPAPTTVEVGRHRVRFLVPDRWEHLDHGRQQLFRLGEAELSLVDLGPATHEALRREIREAEALWYAGRRKDAFQRIRELHGPALQFSTSDQRLAFRTPWTDATYIEDAAESLAVGRAFTALLSGVDSLAEATPEHVLEYVLERRGDMRRSEIASTRQVRIHGTEWTDVETWDRVTHQNRSRVAFVVNDGCMLVLAKERGVYEQIRPGFGALLASLEVAPTSPARP